MENFDLLSTVEYGGCSAKLPAGKLEELLKDLPVLRDDKLLVGNDTHDDASVYRINSETAIINTTDFFPPVCSDPYEFGQIAAANSLSDVYAMGGIPLTALNLVMFPSTGAELEMLREILRGGADKCIEASCVLAGGHTIDDYPPKYGLAVTGTVHPDRIITNAAAKPGDILVLTKALGTAVMIAAKRIDEAADSDYRAALESMKMLNRSGAEIMQKHGIRCATDVTGFSLLGHCIKLARASGVRMEIDSSRLPVLPGVYDLIEFGCIPGASFRNLKYFEQHAEFGDGLDYNLKMLALDAQTSGGLLICIPEDDADSVVEELKRTCPETAVIGKADSAYSSGAYVRLS